MLFSWSDFLAFLHRSTMGCFAGCFGITDDRRRQPPQLVSQAPPANSREPVLNTNRKRLATLLLSEDKDGSPRDGDKKYHLAASPEADGDFNGLKDEAKFLKACGTLPATPAEIRKASEVLKVSPCDQDSESLKFHSWLPDASFQKLNLEMQPDQCSPIKLSEEWVTGSGSSSCTTSSCITNTQIPARTFTSITENSGSCIHGMGSQVHNNQNASVQQRNKSVQFDCQSDMSSFSPKCSSEVSCQSSNKSVLTGDESVSKPSPYPTPLQISDDMQTPGTIFPSYVRETMGNGRNPRIRSQYVYSVMTAVENSFQWNVLKEEDSQSSQLSSNLIESLQKADKPAPRSEAGMIKNSAAKEIKVEESLSSWLKPVQTSQNGNNQRAVTFATENVYVGKNPGDRPIIGMVAAHWNEDETTRVSPKWWDGNGIPNSTTKYKEDQKVSWHATPFEERLEKALSEESSNSQRKNLSGTPPINFNQNEECDTALSQMKSSTHRNSVVSY